MTTKVTKTPAIALLGSQKAIMASLKSIKERGGSIQADIHTAACSILKHLDKHGDIRMVINLLDAMPDVVRVNSLKTWLEAFGKVSFTDSEGKAMKHPAYVGSKSTKLGEAMAKPFWKFKANEGVAYVPLDIANYLDDQIKRLELDQKKGGHTNNVLLISAFRTHRDNIANKAA